MIAFDALPLILNLVIFLGLAAVVWLSGTRLSYLLDGIAEQTKIARGFLGLIVLATATELPELVTTLTASYGGNAALALNNMFGGIAMQTAVLAVVDLCILKVTLTSRPTGATPILEGVMLMFLLSSLLVISQFGDFAPAGHVGLGVITVAGLYIAAIALINSHRKTGRWSPVDLPDNTSDGQDVRTNKYDRYAVKSLGVYTIIASGAILGAGVLLVQVADVIAQQSGLGSSFIGVSLLAATTSLPELSTAIAAVRVRAYTMAISNIFGSNLIMIFLLLPAEIFYRSGTILSQIDASARFALSAGICVTAIYCAGLLLRSERRIFRMGVDSAFVLAGYLASLYILYLLR